MASSLGIWGKDADLDPVLASLSQAMTSDTAARFTRYPSVVHFTRDHMPSQALGPPTFTVTVTLTGKKP
jgi:hypothetical protein